MHGGNDVTISSQFHKGERNYYAFAITCHHWQGPNRTAVCMCKFYLPCDQSPQVFMKLPNQGHSHLHLGLARGGSFDLGDVETLSGLHPFTHRESHRHMSLQEDLAMLIIPTA